MAIELLSLIKPLLLDDKVNIIFSETHSLSVSSTVDITSVQWQEHIGHKNKIQNKKGLFTLHIYPPTKQFIWPCAFIIAGMQIVRPAAQCRFTLTWAGLLLRVDKYESHQSRQFSNEHSINQE